MTATEAHKGALLLSTLNPTIITSQSEPPEYGVQLPDGTTWWNLSHLLQDAQP